MRPLAGLDGAMKATAFLLFLAFRLSDNAVPTEEAAHVSPGTEHKFLHAELATVHAQRQSRVLGALAQHQDP